MLQVIKGRLRLCILAPKHFWRVPLGRPIAWTEINYERLFQLEISLLGIFLKLVFILQLFCL